MRVEEGTVIGSVTVEETLLLKGTVTGDATVESGGELELDGTVSGMVRVRPGGSASVNGTVVGDVVNDGALVVRGMIIGRLDTGPNASTTIERFAQVSGVTY